LIPEHYRTPLPPLDTSGKLILYRISRTRYADLSGMGATKAPGRWNTKNPRAVYTSLEVGTAVLEVLSHLDPDTIRIDHSLMTISVETEGCACLSTEVFIGNVTEPDPALLPDDRLDCILLTHRSLEHAVAAGQKPYEYLIQRGIRNLLGLIAPSIFVPAYNLVLYPDNPAFASLVKIESVQPFSFHPYLFSSRAASKEN
jgi:RES domain-containing protein